MNEIQKLEDEEPAGRRFIETMPVNKSLVLENVSFSYAGSGNRPVLNNINVEIPPNKVTAIVGSSGSGKTTLIKLLMKFYAGLCGDYNISGERGKFAGYLIR